MHGALEALQYLHTKLNILHRDIKAANFLLTDEGKLKLSMFDLQSSSFTSLNFWPAFYPYRNLYLTILVSNTFLVSNALFLISWITQLISVWVQCWRTRRRSARVWLARRIGWRLRSARAHHMTTRYCLLYLSGSLFNVNLQYVNHWLASVRFDFVNFLVVFI